MIALWCISNFAYFLLASFLKYIKGDVFYNTLSSAYSEIAANLSSVFMAQKLSYKGSIIINFWIAAISMGALAIYQSSTNEDANYTLIAWLVIICKFGIAAARNLINIGNPRLFEMSILATSLGLCAGSSRITNILASPIAEI